MADGPDLDQLAKQYLDLWQDHLKTMAADPQVAETMSQVTQMMTGSATAFAAMAQQVMAQQAKTAGGAHEETPNQDTNRQPNDARTDDATTTTGEPIRAADAGGSGTTADGASHGGANLDLAEFARRLDGIEGRLAALEAGTGGTGKPASKRSRRSSG